MRRTLRLFLCHWLLAGVAVPLAASAQETRGKISGTVRDSAGVIPGASVKITNTDTNVSQNFTTNESGYFEAPFLNPGDIFNRQQWLGPNLNPTSTQFGQVTTVALNQMRFFSFGIRATF